MGLLRVPHNTDDYCAEQRLRLGFKPGRISNHPFVPVRQSDKRLSAVLYSFGLSLW